MPTPNPEAFNFLMTRRSRPAKTLVAPWPDMDALKPILTAAARAPDHGKLEPWRFLVLLPDALDRLAAAVEAHGTKTGVDPDKIAKATFVLRETRLVVAVVGAPKPSEKIPHLEQVLSAGAVCLSLVNAALAQGWGANWLSGWHSHDTAFMQEHLALAPTEFIAGFIHIGTESVAPPERPRPDIEAITTVVST